MNNRRSTPLPLLAASAAAASVLLLPLKADAQERPNRGGDRPAMRGSGQGPGFAPGQGPGMGSGGVAGTPWQQFRRPGSFSHLLIPDYHLRDLTILAQQLELDQGQRPIIEALIIDYRQVFTEAASELEDAAQRVRRTGFGQGMIPAGFGGSSEGGPSIVTRSEGGNIFVELPGRDGLVELQLEGRFSVAFDPSETPGSGTPQVSTSMVIMGPDGIVIEGDLPPEMQERLERINERMQQRRERMEQWREREAAREAAGELLEPSEVAAIAREFHNRKEHLRSRFVADIDLMLSPFQQEQWPLVQQSLRRLNQLQQSQLSGEQIDLTRIVRDLHVSQHHMRELESILEQYVRDLDAAIARRTEFLNEADISRFEALHGNDWDRLLSLADREAELRKAVRTVNDMYTARIADALSENDRDRFVTAVNDRAFPQLAQTTRASRFFHSASELDSLDADQRELIQLLKADHDRQLAALNEKQRQSLRESEPLRTRGMLELFQRMRSGEMQGARPPMMDFVEHQRERSELTRTYVNQLRALIPEEVMPELHEQDRAREWRGFGENFDTRQIIQDGERFRTREILIDVGD